MVNLVSNRARLVHVGRFTYWKVLRSRKSTDSPLYSQTLSKSTASNRQTPYDPKGKGKERAASQDGDYLALNMAGGSNQSNGLGGGMQQLTLVEQEVIRKKKSQYIIKLILGRFFAG